MLPTEHLLFIQIFPSFHLSHHLCHIGRHASAHEGHYNHNPNLAVALGNVRHQVSPVNLKGCKLNPTGTIVLLDFSISLEITSDYLTYYIAYADLGQNMISP